MASGATTVPVNALNQAQGAGVLVHPSRNDAHSPGTRTNITTYFPASRCSSSVSLELDLRYPLAFYLDCFDLGRPRIATITRSDPFLRRCDARSSLRSPWLATLSPMPATPKSLSQTNQQIG